VTLRESKCLTIKIAGYRYKVRWRDWFIFGWCHESFTTCWLAIEIAPTAAKTAQADFASVGADLSAVCNKTRLP
jgi:hypothetical protein